MKTRIVRIGNSRGIRIPKPLLDQAGLNGEVVMKVQKGALIIRPAKKPREGWEEALKEMSARGDDALLDDPIPSTEFDRNEWTW